MGGKKIKALTSCGRSGWVNSRTENKERTLFLFNNLLTGCPVPKASAVRKHLPALDSIDNSLALNCIQSLFADLDGNRFYVNYELRGVAKHLISNGLADGGIPSSNNEFLAFTKTPIGMLKDGYGLFPDKDKKAITISDAKPYDAILTLDGCTDICAIPLLMVSLLRLNESLRATVNDSLFSISRTLMRKVRFPPACSCRMNASS